MSSFTNYIYERLCTQLAFHEEIECQSNTWALYNTTHYMQNWGTNTIDCTFCSRPIKEDILTFCMNYLVNYLVRPPCDTTPRRPRAQQTQSMTKPIQSFLILVKQFLNEFRLDGWTYFCFTIYVTGILYYGRVHVSMIDKAEDEFDSLLDAL